MGNNPICTSVEQAQTLISKGLTEDTADMYYVIRRHCEPRLALLVNEPPKGLLNAIPAWSLSALINQLPEFVNFKGVDYCLMMLSDRVVYWNPTSENLFEDTEANLLDAVVNTLIWLADNNEINY